MPQFKVLFVLCLEIIFNSKWSCVMACSFHSFFNFSNSRKFIVNSCFRVHMCICMFKDCLLIVYCVLRWFFPCLRLLWNYISTYIHNLGLCLCLKKKMLKTKTNLPFEMILCQNLFLPFFLWILLTHIWNSSWSHGLGYKVTNCFCIECWSDCLASKCCKILPTHVARI